MSVYKGAAKQLEDIDLPRLGGEIGVGEDVLRTLLEVETSGEGFDKQGRVRMLFEPHVFWRLLSGEQRAQAVDEGLAYRKWGEKKYPRDSYDRLDRAMAINRIAALKSCSWGLGQVMGENHKAAGYTSVEKMVSAFAEDEENQLKGMISFIIANHIDDDLRRIEEKTKAGKKVTAADWIPIVRVYNGSGYAKNDYHNRAARAYNKWLKIKDTPLAQVIDIKTAAKVEEITSAVTVTTQEVDAQAGGEPGSKISIVQKAKSALGEMEPESRKSLLSAVSSKVWGVLCAGALYAANNPVKIVVIGVIAVGGFAILYYYMKRQKDKTMALIRKDEAVTVAALKLAA